MNNLTKRNIKLLKILYDAGDYISSIRLADELDISIRTVKSEIKSINAVSYTHLTCSYFYDERS